MNTCNTVQNLLQNTKIAPGYNIIIYGKII